MADRENLDQWVIEALKQLGGRGTIVEIAKEIWEKYEKELQQSGDLFYTWQYEYRWSGKRLRDEGKILPAEMSPRGIWVLKD